MQLGLEREPAGGSNGQFMEQRGRPSNRATQPSSTPLAGEAGQPIPLLLIYTVSVRLVFDNLYSIWTDGANLRKPEIDRIRIFCNQ